MKGRSLLALPALLLALACEGNKQPTGPSAPIDPSAVISDGAHNGNPDFFFLPPLVPNPVNDPNFDRGEFNSGLAPSLTVEICELDLNAGLPTTATSCVAGPPLKKFAPGTVRLVTHPLGENGWWTGFNLPSDGFYSVVWDTRQSDLKLDKFYRIKVLIDGSSVPLGVADVDPMSSMREWHNTRTGEVIPMIDDVLLPIPFRVENGALCEGASLCTSITVTNDNPNGDYQIVRVEGNAGPIAGALLPDGWLPPGGVQSVVLTISEVNTGANDVGAGTQANPCHANLPLEQFNGCFHYSTIPELPIINEAGNQFAKAITLAVCFVLIDTPDPREPFVQLWSSDDGTDVKPLPSAPDALILTNHDARNCGTNLVAANNSNRLAQFASVGWRKLKGGLGGLFGVQTAYAVDLGLGGTALDISNIGPALTAQIQRYTSTGLTLGPGSTTTSTARIVGTVVHNGGTLTTGIGGLPVTFTVAPGNGTLRLIGSEAAPATELTSITNTNPIDPASPVSGGGFAPVNWTMPTPTAPGTYTYTLTANGPATGGPVTFTATVTVVSSPIITFETYPSGAPACAGAGACPVTNEFESRGVVFSFSNAGQTASLCRTMHGPVGEGSNYGVSPQSTDCSGWNTGTVTMSFTTPYPTTVEFQLEGNDGDTSPFAVTATDANNISLTVTRVSYFTYLDGVGNIFRREIRRVTSTGGIQAITVNSAPYIHIIDNLLLTP